MTLRTQHTGSNRLYSQLRAYWVRGIFLMKTTVSRDTTSSEAINLKSKIGAKTVRFISPGLGVRFCLGEWGLCSLPACLNLLGVLDYQVFQKMSDTCKRGNNQYYAIKCFRTIVYYYHCDKLKLGLQQNDCRLTQHELKNDDGVGTIWMVTIDNNSLLILQVHHTVDSKSKIRHGIH